MYVRMLVSFYEVPSSQHGNAANVFVGALKAAHVGISIINDPELERKMDSNHLRQQDSEVVDKKVN